MSDHITKKLAKTNTKRALERIRTQLMLPQDFEDAYEISYMLRHQLTFYNHVININFNILAQLWFKHFGHHPLIS